MNHKRKKPRHRGSPHRNVRVSKRADRGTKGYWLNSWPRWHDVLFHTRPRRRRTKVVEIKLMKGADPDAMVAPISKKPHVYYW